MVQKNANVSILNMASLSPLQRHRLSFQPKVPAPLKEISQLVCYPLEQQSIQALDPDVLKRFPQTNQQKVLGFKKGGKKIREPLKVGVVLSGGQAPGGHNVITGLFDALKIFHPDSLLIGFCSGPSGIVDNKTVMLTADIVSAYRNQGGFDMIGSGRTKIETQAQFSSAAATVKELGLDGLVVIGGDDSNTNAAFLAEDFKSRGLKTKVIGVPKTIDGDLKNEFIEISFGFDTASKIYSEMIGNILIDMLSAKKYYYFIKLMGRSASHITLECALQTHPNMALISEEVAEKKQTLSQIVDDIVEMICQRAKLGKHYGAILIPEGLIEFIPEFKKMIAELNAAAGKGETGNWSEHLSPESKHCFDSIPKLIQSQLMLERDPHGNVQVSKIETERLLITMVEQQLERLRIDGVYKGKFSAQPLFFGYEGRAGLPSNFDAQYCYALGYVAALLLNEGMSGYMSCVKDLTKPPEEWQIFGVPILNMLHKEKRGGEDKTVIKKALVDLQGEPFKQFQTKRKKWLEEDEYRSPGPIQFSGDASLTENITFTLQYESDL